MTLVFCHGNLRPVVWFEDMACCLRCGAKLPWVVW